MRRRAFLRLSGAAGLTAAAYLGTRFWPDEGFINPCLAESMPNELLSHDLVLGAWEGLNPRDVWDCHVHLIGMGDGDTGTWVNPDMRSPLSPVQFTQMKFYMNASCVDEAEGSIDAGFVERLRLLLRGFPPGVKLMLLAFDYHHDERGQRLLSASAYHTPDSYAHRVVQAHPNHFEWIASIHPYREDAVQALEAGVATGARAVKWLPPAMGIDPGSPKCDPFYAAMARMQVPLLTHAGAELAVHGAGAQAVGNPLLLRRPLDHGVPVIVAHCASLGGSTDLDRGPNGPQVDNFELFARLMDESRYDGLLFGDLSAMTQINRLDNGLAALLEREEWHGRLLNGSDYPLPGVMPLFSLQALVDRGLLSEGQARVLSQIRAYNPLLFDFLCKRSLASHGKQFQPAAFATRRVFERFGTGAVESARREGGKSL